MSELESDIEPMSPATKSNGGTALHVPQGGMSYLSPFTMCSRSDRTISESNLSSSGYSSMASPGPSRCGSSNPLYPGEMDDPGGGHHHPTSNFTLHANIMHRKKSATLPSCKENVSNGKASTNTNTDNDADSSPQHSRNRSDSETYSDDIILESNDEGIGTDNLDEKGDGGPPNICIEGELVEFGKTFLGINEPSAISNQMAQLQLPSIVIQMDGVDKVLSPVSSRSESPLSERAGLGRFSPHFYGRKDQLPFTDSDGLYDFPSSDGKGAAPYSHQRRSSSKKRERKSSKSGPSQSPTKLTLETPDTKGGSSPSNGQIHICSKHCHALHHGCHNALTVRKSPKRRSASRHLVASSSSSTESLTTSKTLNPRIFPRASECNRYNVSRIFV
ncbi:hypothetical protein ACFFRR_001878 [Megaselia abdita]